MQGNAVTGGGERHGAEQWPLGRGLGYLTIISFVYGHLLNWNKVVTGRLFIFSAPEPKAQVHYCDHALSVVRPSSVRPSSLTFHIFDFSFETAKQNSMKLDRKQDLNVLYQVCIFRADRKNKMAAPASDWLRHFRLLLWNRWTEFNETLQEARSQSPLPSMFFGPIGKTRWPPWPIRQKGGTLYSGARYVALLASCLEREV